MANIRIDLNYEIKDGTKIVFRSPCDCTEITGLIVYYVKGGVQKSKEFTLADAHGENVGDIPNLFASDAVVKVILDVTAGMAFVQNGDTNAYIESTFIKSVNGVKPDKNGNVEISVPGGGGSGATPDWNAAEGEQGYILNRPFYKTAYSGMLLENSQLVYIEENGMFAVMDEFHLQVGNEYVVTWNGVDYICTAFEFRESPEAPAMPAVGNKAMIGEAPTEEPFFLAGLPDGFEAEEGLWGVAMDITGATEATVSIQGSGFVVTKIPEEYLPDSALTTKYTVNFTRGQYDLYFTNTPIEDVLSMIERGLNVVARIPSLTSVGFYELQLAGCFGSDIRFSMTDAVYSTSLLWDSHDGYATLTETDIETDKTVVEFSYNKVLGKYSTSSEYGKISSKAGDRTDVVARVLLPEGTNYATPKFYELAISSKYNDRLEFSGLIDGTEIMHLIWTISDITVTRKPFVDKDTIVQEVLDQLGTGVIGEVDADNNILITSTLPNGTYTMRYENADGSTTVIGTFTVSGSDPAPDPGPAYTNLADPTSADWLTNKRINSSKAEVEVTAAQRGDQTVVTTNKIAISGVTKLHVKGLDIMSNLTASSNNYGRYHVYNGSGELVQWQLQPSSDGFAQYFTTADYDSSVTVIDVPGLVTKVGYANQTHVRLGGILTGAAEDVIITADQKIV